MGKGADDLVPEALKALGLLEFEYVWESHGSIVTASGSNRVILTASQTRRGRGWVVCPGPGLVDQPWSARAPRRDPHEHRVWVGVTTEVPQEDVALRDGRRDEQIIVEELRGPCPDL